MKKYILSSLVLALSCLVFFTACDDDDAADITGNVDISFNAVYDGTPLDIQAATYDYPSGADLKVQLFQYYISDLSLLPADGGDAVQLSEIELIRYNTAGASNAQALTFDNVPVGEYSGLRFGLGVKPELNNQPPSNFAADFVLNEAEYWNDMVRYVFAKIEANVDLENDGTFDTPVSYHMGNNDIYTTLTFSGDFSIAENMTTEFEVLADVLSALAASDTDFHDFSDPDQRIVHGGNQAISADIWTRLRDQFRLSIVQ
ncbi:MAG: MbnP family protein [Bacteroidota bacterium]